MWHLQSINKNTYNCFQFLTATISKFYDCDYRLMMLELWGFLYDEAAVGMISDKLKLCWNYKTDKRKYLLNYHGLSFDIIVAQELDVEKFIFDNISKFPIAVYIDSYICSWIPFYQKIHRPHALFVLGEESGKYLFLDQYSHDNKRNEIDIEFIKSNTISFVIFKQDTRKYNIKINDLIIEKLNDWEQYGFSSYKSFLFDMKNNLNILKEVTNDPVASKLVMYLKNLSEDRINFVEAVNLFEEYFLINLNVIKDNLTDVAARYEKLRAYIIKCAFLNCNHKIEKISDELDRIYSSEQLIYNKLQTLIK